MPTGEAEQVKGIYRQNGENQESAMWNMEVNVTIMIWWYFHYLVILKLLSLLFT